MEEVIGAIDQGTSSTRFILFNNKGESVASSQVEFDLIFPKPGWAEVDGLMILETVIQCMEEATKKYNLLKNTKMQLKGIGVTNQRETTIVWDKYTGKPLYNAIVWLDTRTAEICSKIIANHSNNKDCFREKVGLPISTYFSAVKLMWLIENVPKVKEAIDQKRCLFGTIDSWIIWNLTGGVNGGKHVTDVTNASRTLLFNLKTLDWDFSICKELAIDVHLLPSVKSSAEIYGYIPSSSSQDQIVKRLIDIFPGVPICGCLGDQQAALVGQSCFHVGDVKNTYGTGCFMLFNTGNDIVQSTHGMLTTVAYKFGEKEVKYALEGSIAIAGAAVKWIRDNMGIINSSSEIEILARKVEDPLNAGVFFVPALTGLFAPYWRSDARGVIVGLTQYTNKCHIARATLEATCFQTREIIEAMEKDSFNKIKQMKVDGGMTVNSLLLQLQSDILGIPVVKPQNTETTALGAALAAGIALGIWTEESIPTMSSTSYNSQVSKEERDQRFNGWKDAVKRSFNLA